MINILEIKDTEDGGAIVSIELDREDLEIIVSQWLNNAIMEKVNETLSKTATREVAKEDGSSSDADYDEEADWKKVWSEFSETEYADSLAAEVINDPKLYYNK